METDGSVSTGSASAVAGGDQLPHVPYAYSNKLVNNYISFLSKVNVDTRKVICAIFVNNARRF